MRNKAALSTQRADCLKMMFIADSAELLQVIYVRPRDDVSASKSESPPIRSWAYVGSANCSESAWGKLIKDRTTKSPKLNCRNWECGVIVPANPANNGQGMKAFEGVVPVPFQYPGERYEGRQPWYFTEQ